jgi:hypothetical protein
MENRGSNSRVNQTMFYIPFNSRKKHFAAFSTRLNKLGIILELPDYVYVKQKKTKKKRKTKQKLVTNLIRKKAFCFFNNI